MWSNCKLHSSVWRSVSAPAAIPPTLTECVCVCVWRITLRHCVSYLLPIHSVLWWLSHEHMWNWQVLMFFFIVYDDVMFIIDMAVNSHSYACACLFMCVCLCVIPSAEKKEGTFPSNGRWQLSVTQHMHTHTPHIQYFHPLIHTNTCTSFLFQRQT